MVFQFRVGQGSVAQEHQAGLTQLLCNRQPRLWCQAGIFEVLLQIIQRQLLGVCHEAAVGEERRSCMLYPKDEGGPLDIAFKEVMSNHPKLLRSRVVVVSVGGKGRLDLSV